MANASFKRDQVVEIIGSVIKRMSSTQDQSLLSEVNALKSAIDGLYKDLGDAHPGDIKSQIPNATNELTAVVSTTEDATHRIMKSCEDIQKSLEKVPLEQSSAIEASVIAIVEACTFQDLTGQRIKKIIKSLGDIDSHATALLSVLQSRFGDIGASTKKAVGSKEPVLMNGPQLPGQGISQEEIDKLLNDFA